MMIKNF